MSHWSKLLPKVCIPQRSWLSGSMPCSSQPVPLSKLKDAFLDGTSSTYLEELEERFRDDPTSVDKTWASFFNNLGTASPRLPLQAKAALVYAAFNNATRSASFELEDGGLRVPSFASATAWPGRVAAGTLDAVSACFWSCECAQQPP